jgi:predicted MFS family arabinose efflux permease
LSTLDRLRGGLPGSFYAVAFAGFLWEMGLFMTQPILTLHYLNIGASILFIGLILGLQAFLLIFLRLPLTILATRVGERRMLAVSFASQTLQLALIGFAQSPAWLYFIPFVQLVATGTFFQLITAINSGQAPPERQGDALGRHMTIVSAGMFIGPALCGVLVAPLGYSRVFLVASLFPLAGLAILLRVTRGLGAVRSLRSNEVPSLTSLRALLGQRNVVALAVIRTLYSTSNNLFLTLFSIYAVQSLGFDPSLVAVLYSIQGVANALVKVPMGWASDRWGRKAVLLTTFSGVVLCYVGFATLTAYPLVAAVMLFFGACWGARAVTEWAFLAVIVPPESRTIAIGYMESFWDIGSSAGSLFAGVAVGLLPYQTIFLLLAALNLPAIPSILLMREERR